jgi:ADP-ribose pyrophosphatase YjhB (NUDIX family)
MTIPSSFCPRCGHPMEEREVDGRRRPVCPSCDFVLYLNPKVAVGVIVVQDGQTVLVRRGIGPRTGTWVFPGGYVDLGEAVDEAAQREVLEETGLTVSLDRLLGVYSRPGDEVVLIVYVGFVTQGVARAGSECLELRWFSPDALPPPDELGFWSTAAALQDWRAGR